MNLLQALVATKGKFRGKGVNHEGENFTGELIIEPMVGGAAVLLRYRAQLDDGSVAHEECTLLSSGPDGRLTLWPVMSELDVVLPHVQIKDTAHARTASSVGGVFASGEQDEQDTFREEITIELSHTGELTYAHAWGLPGGKFEDRSSCCMAPSEA
jgi:hypothetical protein